MARILKEPMKATDIDLTQLETMLPLLVMPKIDGVRMVNDIDETSTVYARTMKPFKNKFANFTFSNSDWHGIDSECTIGPAYLPETGGATLCSLTTSALNSVKGEPELVRWAFDYIGNGCIDKPFIERYNELKKVVANSSDARLKLVPCFRVETVKEYYDLQEYWVSLGYEGVIIRKADSPYKQGRCTLKEGYLLRDKGFQDDEGIVVEVTEAMTNNNEQTVDETGRMKRSSHAENKTPKGCIGNIKIKLIRDVKHKITGRLLFEKGREVIIGPGKMPHAERVYYWENVDLFIGQTVKWKFFPNGVKDEPRFPTYESLRMKEDM